MEACTRAAAECYFYTLSHLALWLLWMESDFFPLFLSTSTEMFFNIGIP